MALMLMSSAALLQLWFCSIQWSLLEIPKTFSDSVLTALGGEQGVRKPSEALKTPLEMSHTSSLLPSTGQTSHMAKLFVSGIRTILSKRYQEV